MRTSSRSSHLVRFVCAALFAQIPLVARAQSLTDTGSPVFAPATVRVGQVELAPSWLTSNGVDTNVTRVGGAPVQSYEFFTVPQFDLNYRADLFKIGATATGEYAYTPGETEAKKKSNFNNLTEARMAWDKTLFRPSFSIMRRDTYARPDFEIGRRSQRVLRTIDAGLEWVPGGRLKLEGGFNNARTRYDADAIFAGVLLAEKLNFDVYTTRVLGTLKVTPLMSAVGGMELTRERFLVAPARDGNGYRAYGGVSFAPSALLFGTVYGGVRNFTPLRVADRAFTGSYLNGTLGYGRGEFRLIGSVNRDIAFSYDADKGIFVATTGHVTVRRDLPHRIEVDVEGEVQQLTYQGAIGSAPIGDFRRFEAVATAGLRLKPWMKVGGTVDREIARGNQVWDAWRFTAFLAYGVVPVRRLDRPQPLWR